MITVWDIIVLVVFGGPIIYILGRHSAPHIKKAYLDWKYPIFEGPLTWEEYSELLKKTPVSEPVVVVPVVYVDIELKLKELFLILQKTSIEMKVLVAYFLDSNIDKNPLLDGTMALKIFEQERNLARVNLWLTTMKEFHNSENEAFFCGYTTELTLYKNQIRDLYIKNGLCADIFISEKKVILVDIEDEKKTIAAELLNRKYSSMEDYKKTLEYLAMRELDKDPEFCASFEALKAMSDSEKVRINTPKSSFEGKELDVIKNYTPKSYLEVDFYYFSIFLDIFKWFLPIFWFGIFGFCLYFFIKKLCFLYNCWKTKTLKAEFFNWLFNSYNVRYITQLGISIPNFFFVGLLSKYMKSPVGWYIFISMFYGLGLVSGLNLLVGVGYYFLYFLFFRIYILPTIKYLFKLIKNKITHA